MYVTTPPYYSLSRSKTVTASVAPGGQERWSDCTKQQVRTTEILRLKLAAKVEAPWC